MIKFDKQILNDVKSQMVSLLPPNLFGKTESSQSTGSQTIISCDFGQSQIVFLEIKKSSEGITLLSYQKVSRPREKDKELEVIRQSFDTLGVEQRKVRLSVKGQGLVVRFIQFPKMEKKELKSAIGFEAEKFIPFKSDEVVVDYHIVEEVSPGNDKMMDLLMVAAKKTEIYPLIQLFQSADIRVELIDIDALAFLNCLEYFNPEAMKSCLAMLDIGTELSTLTIVRGGKPRFIRDISFGGTDLLKRLKRKLGLTEQQALEQIEVDKAPSDQAKEVLIEGLGVLISDLKVSIDYYLEQMQPSEAVTKLYICGGGGYHPLIIDVLSKDLGIPVEMIDIMSKVKLDARVDAETIKKNIGALPVALGLALRD